MRSRLTLVALLLASATGVADAQTTVEGRVTRLESEMRAVQRRVFPGGAGRTLQPEVEAAAPAGVVPGIPSQSALADLTARVAALEGQIASLTGQTEQAGFRSRQVQEQFDAYRRATDARLRALEGGRPTAGSGTGPVASPADRPTAVDEAEAAPSPDEPTPRPTPRPTTGTTRPTSTTPARPTAADPGRAARVAAVERPSTGNAVEDAYTYGYRLWQARLYTEAQNQLKVAAAAGPANRRFSFAQNLLGRAYLDDNKPSLASMAFYDNYKRAPDGERAPESLYYLAQALMRLNKATDACKVYDELSDVYASRLTTQMRADVATGRQTARCRPAT